jgi:hypothetical protein
MDNLAKIIDFVRQPRILFCVSLATGLIVFLPDQALQQMGLLQLRDAFRPYWGGIFIITSVIFVTEISLKVVALLSEKRKIKLIKQKQVEQLSSLTQEERELLNGFIRNKKKTRRLDVDSGVVFGLVNKSIIYLASSRATSAPFDYTYHGRVYTADYNIHDWAWDYLNQHQELLSQQEGMKEQRLTQGG